MERGGLQRRRRESAMGRTARNSPDRCRLWGRSNGLEVGDRSRSQLFMWRALSFLKPDGVAAMLIAATPFHNVRSRKFRIQWLSAVDLVSIVDFTAARRMFFRGGSAPFALVIFSPNTPGEAAERFTYRNVRPSRVLDSTRSMAYARRERRWVSQQALLHRDYLWKTYAWGGHRDAALMARFDAEKQLDEIVSMIHLPDGVTSTATLRARRRKLRRISNQFHH